MYFYRFSLTLLVIFILSFGAHAEEKKSDFLKKRRGLVTSSKCPFDCRNLNLASDLCREWESGDTCYVEDYTQVPGHRSMIRVPTSAFSAPTKSSSVSQQQASEQRGRMARPEASRKGMITSAQCPYSCKSAGVPENLCQDWSDGVKCYVEDFTQVPGHRSMIRIPE